MGLSIQTCSCIKGGQDEKKSEFFPEFSKNMNANKRNINFSVEKNNIDFSSNPVSTRDNYDISLKKNVTFSFRKSFIERAKTLSPDKIAMIQRIFRAYIYRKRFFKTKGIKDLLKQDSNETIQKKESEFISETLIETDKIIKKEFNDDFLDKLQLKESINSPKFLNKKKIKTNCLIGKDSNGEEFFYRGELDLEGKPNGYGELYLKSGKKYEGKFKNGKLNDYGRLIDLFGIKCYEGKFQDNQLMDGKGKIIEIKENGSKVIYEGDIKNMKREGKGIQKNENCTYMGDFRNDLKDGHGKAVFNDGDVYEGDFKNDKMTGQGLYQFKENKTYEGEFLDGKFHGKGILKYDNGTEFQGNFVNNLKEGYGEYRRKKGKNYHGMYKANKKHGKGVIIYENGERKEVEYFEDQLVRKHPETEGNTNTNTFTETVK